MHASHWKTQHVFYWVIKNFTSIATTESLVAHGSLALCPHVAHECQELGFQVIAQSHVCIAAPCFFRMCKFRWHLSGLLSWITCEQMSSSLVIHDFPMQAHWWRQWHCQAVCKKSFHDHATWKRTELSESSESWGGLGIIFFTSGNPGCRWSSVVHGTA